jgi:ADP-ribose pyrophosphatase YjhB (NUDIX family)
MPHIHELYDFVVTVFIVHKDKVLLVHHPRYGKWIPMGGHIELDEDPEEALFR